MCVCVYNLYSVFVLCGTCIALTFLQDVKTGCGVMFDVVTGIPKSEGMQRPPKIPANPSFVELSEDENAVEKFKTAMASISNILTLDRLKQVSIHHVQVVLLYSIMLAHLLHTSTYLYHGITIMAYGSMPYVGMAPKKNGGHIKSVQMTRSKCLR